jgi:hypothetical protein
MGQARDGREVDASKLKTRHRFISAKRPRVHSLSPLCAKKEPSRELSRVSCALIPSRAKKPSDKHVAYQPCMVTHDHQAQPWGYCAGLGNCRNQAISLGKNWMTQGQTSEMAMLRQLTALVYNALHHAPPRRTWGHILSLDWTRSIAYLKRKLPEDGSPALSLGYEESPVLRDLNNGLLVSYLVDEENSFSYVQHRHLLAAEIDENAVHQAAIENLYRIAERHLKIQQHGPVFTVFMEGNFEASVLLLDAVWDNSFANYIRGDFVAAIPSRDVLAFGDSSSTEGIAELRAIIDRVATGSSDHIVSTSLYRRCNRVWSTYDI